MFDIQLSNYNPDTPSFYVILVTGLFAFVLSGLIALTYRFTTRDLYRRNHFIQSLAMIGIVAATIMQAIGDSVAVGLGLIGALAIIRFRSSLNDPRNITFMFASLAAGIAAGVLGFHIALTGTLVFCLAALLMRYSPFHDHLENIGELRFQMPDTGDPIQKITLILQDHCRQYEMDSLRINPGKSKPPESGENEETPLVGNIREYKFSFVLKKGAELSNLEKAFRSLEGVESLSIRLENKTAAL